MLSDETDNLSNEDHSYVFFNETQKENNVNKLEEQHYDNENTNNNPFGESTFTSENKTSNNDFLFNQSHIYNAFSSRMIEMKEFIGHFSIPTNRTIWLNRMKQNLSQFKFSYLIIMSLTSIYILLTSPILMIELAALVFLWVIFFRFYKGNEIIHLGKYQIGKITKIVIMAVFTALVSFFGGLMTSLIYMGLMGSSVILLHASFRETSQLYSTNSVDSNIYGDSTFNRI